MSDRIQQVLERKGTHVEVTHPRQTILGAVEQMNARKIGALLVRDSDRPLGIITERDVLARVVARSLPPEITTVGDVMTRLVYTVKPQTTVAQAMMLMTDHKCRHLPVVDGDQICGLVSIGDLTSWLVRDQLRTFEDLRATERTYVSASM